MSTSFLMTGRGQSQSISASLVTETCWVCGCHFAFERTLYDRAGKLGQSFYCPNGHELRYGDTALIKAERELAAERERLAQARRYADSAREAEMAAVRSARASRGQVTKIKKRITNGVCPCCNRVFSELQKHMRSEHPEYEQT